MGLANKDMAAWNRSEIARHGEMSKYQAHRADAGRGSPEGSSRTHSHRNGQVKRQPALVNCRPVSL